MRRREFIKLIASSATAWPVVARAQQSTMPRVGFLGGTSPEVYADRLRAFRQGVKEMGYVEGRNVEVEYLWAEGHNEQLQALAARLVRLQATVIVAGGGTPSALAAKAATTTIPIIFGVAVDPVALGLVDTLNRPGGNVTGVTNLNVEVGPKRLELLRELLPSAKLVAVLVNPANPALGEPFVRELEAAAHMLQFQLHVLHARTDVDFDTAFAALSHMRAEALVISPDQFLTTHIEQLAQLALRHRTPAVSQLRQFAMAGGLMSYGSSEAEYYRPIGIYTGRVLNGEKPSDLPVLQSSKVELVINMKTAKTLDLTVPLPLLGRADEVIEIRRAEDIGPAFDGFKGRAEAIYVAPDPLVFANRTRISTLALGARLASISFVREYVEAGGLMSYGPNYPDLFRNAADYVDKILRGTKPGDIPIQQPTKFELVINLTTAKVLGLAIPEAFLLRADEVIE